MKIETLKSSKFEKFETSEIMELTGSIKGGMVSTCDAKNNDDCLFELSGLDPNDVWTGTCANTDGHYIINAPVFNSMPFVIKDPIQKANNSSQVITTLRNNIKSGRF